MSLGEDECGSGSVAAAPPRKHRWRRRLKIAALVVLIGMVLMRIVLVVALPTVLARVASYYGLQLKYDRESLALFGGQAGLWGVKVYPKAGGDPLLTADYLHGEILPWKLLSGKLYVLRAEADGVDLLVQREADGRIPLLEQLASPSATTQPAAGTAAEAPISFTSPLTIDALRLSSIRAHLIDQSISPKLDAVVAMDIRLTDVGISATVPTLFEIDAWSDKALDLLRIDGTALADGKSLDAKARLFMRGLHPKYCAGYLQPLGFKPTADSIDVEATALVKAAPGPGSSRSLAGSCMIENVALSADNHPAATVDLVNINADSVNSFAARFGKISVEGGSFFGSRDTNGALHLAGFELIPAAAAPVVPSNGSNYAVSFGELSLKNLQAGFHDDAISPAGDLKLLLSEVSVKPRSEGNTMDLAASLSAPGIAKSLHLEGSIQATSPVKFASITLSATDIHPTSLDPYLAPFGVKSELKSGAVSGLLRVQSAPDAQGHVVSSAILQDIRFSDGDALLAECGVSVGGISLQTPAGPWRIKSIELTGPAISATRDPDGSISACGFRYTAPPVSPIPPAPTAAAAPHQASGLPGIVVDAITWKGVKFNLNDKKAGSAIAISNAGFEIKDFSLDQSKSTESQIIGSLHAWLTSPQLAPAGVTVEGTFVPGHGSLAANLKVRGEKLQAAPLAPYLKPFGIEPLLTDGSLSLDAQIGLIGDQLGMITTSVDVKDFVLRDTSNELIGVDELKVDSVSSRPGEFDIGGVNLRHPRGRIAREADGAILAGGMRVQLPVLLAAINAASAAPSTQPTVVGIQQLQFENAQLQWMDQAVKPNVNTTAYVSADVKGLTLGKHAAPATFSADVACEGIVEEAKASGEIDATPGRELLKLELLAGGIHGAGLNGYLPPGIQSTVADGRFHATVLASSDTQRQGGRSAYVDISNADWRDGPNNLLASWRLARLAAPRIDLDGDTISIDELSLDGFQANAAIGKDGAAHLLGLSISQPPVSETAPASSTAPTTQFAPTPDNNPVRAAADVARPVPLMMLKKLDLNVEKFTLRDERRPAAAPIELADVSLRALSPIALGGQFADAQPLAHLELSGAVQPLVKKFSLKMDFLPLAAEPSATFDLDVSGIHGAGVTQILPELAEHLDGSAMESGRFQAKAQIHARVSRRTPREYDFSHGLDLDLAVTDVSFRAEDSGRTLVGADLLRADAIHIGPDGSVGVKALEIEKPALYATREADGLHLLGLVVKLPGGTNTATSQASDAVPAAYTTPANAMAADAPQFSIDRLTVNGADFRLEDHAVNPPLDVPINSVDVEVRDISTAALKADKPIRFSAIAGSNKVDLPRRNQKEATTQPTEPRELFSQVSSSGSISLYPAVHGYAKTSINGVELAAFKGEAAAMGVDLSGGIFDADLSARFKDEGSLDLHSKFVMTDLHLTEPANGPIQTVFKLSAPLDVVIGAVQDTDGGITIPINVPIEKGKISTANLIGAGTGALAQILATAIASAPVKVVAGVGDLVNLGGDKKENGPVVVTLPFAAGETSLLPANQQNIYDIIQLLKKDKNATATIRGQLGGMDRQIAHDRINLTPIDSKALADDFRQQRNALAGERNAMAAAVSTELASGSSSADQSVQKLAAIDRHLAQLDDAADQLYDMLRPGASNQEARRTRAACLQIAGQRLDAVNQIFAAANIPETKESRIVRAPATYNPTDDDAGGSVTVTVIRQKRQK